MRLDNVVAVLFGLVALVCPSLISNFWNDARAKRLEQLRAGSDEAYFEERRQLEAYPIRHVWTVRLIGAVLALLGAVSMFL